MQTVPTVVDNGSVARRIRVLIVGPSLSILGGQAVQAKRLLDAFAGNPNIEVSFLAVNPQLTGVFGKLQRVKYIRTVVTSLAYVASLLWNVRRVDIVHAFSASYASYLLAPLPALVVAKCFGKATVLNYRSGEADDHLARWRLTAVPTMRRFADAIVTPSGYLVRIFAKHGLIARSVANFVSLETLPYRRRVVIKPRLLSNRNLEPLYNVECTIRAFHIVQGHFASASLTVAGDGPQRSSLESLVLSLNLKNVRFLGRVPNERMGALYNDADIYLNSPNIDNMPGSIIEAFACGIPVVSTDAGGIPYVVTHEETGLLTPVDDYKEMANGVLRLLAHSELALKLADSARGQCERQYVWSAVCEQWEELYLGLFRTC